MELTIKIDDIKDDDVHVIATIYKDGKAYGRRVFEKHQLVEETDDLEYEIRKAVREVLIAKSSDTAADIKVELEKTALTIRG